MAEWRNRSRLTQATVSPTRTPVGAGPNFILSMMMVWVRAAATAGSAGATASAPAVIRSCRRESRSDLGSGEVMGQVLGVGLMLLE
ncbi:hypothetical protein D3C87_1241750 [compost metagenome]